MKSKLIVFCLVSLCFCLGAAVADGSAPAVGWSQLVFEANDSDAQVRVTIDLVRSDESELHSAVGGRGSALMPKQGRLQRLSAEIYATAFLLEKKWLGQAWFTADGTALQRTRLKPGSDGDFRRYRYTSEGVARRRFKPEGRKQAALPPEQWGKVKDKFIPYGTGKTNCVPIFDAYALLYPISVHGLDAELGNGICVFNKKSLYRVRLAARLSPPIELTLKQGPKELVARLADGVDPRVIELRPEPLGQAGPEREPFEFMGLEGEISVALDRKTGLPLRLSGELSGLGEVHLDLSEVRLRQ